MRSREPHLVEFLGLRLKCVERISVIAGVICSHSVLTTTVSHQLHSATSKGWNCTLQLKKIAFSDVDERSLNGTWVFRLPSRQGFPIDK